MEVHVEGWEKDKEKTIIIKSYIISESRRNIQLYQGIQGPNPNLQGNKRQRVNGEREEASIRDEHILIVNK